MLGANIPPVFVLIVDTQNGATWTDNDGLWPIYEYWAHTDPNNPDTDGDGKITPTELGDYMMKKYAK